jgi:hypothetical protein
MIPEHILPPTHLNQSRTMPVSYFNDDEMRHFASVRARVQIDNKRTAYLIRWATPKRPGTARVAFHSGTFLTLKTNRVTKVELPDESKEQTNE